MLEETIIAVSTPPGQGGIGVIRISGKRAWAVARNIFRTADRTGTKPAVRRVELGTLYDRQKRIPLDEGFLTFFEAPNSYTGEDVAELSFHGSPVILDMAVKMGVRAGARAAEPGEFTLRAYLNGKIDIIQAEAVNDLIRAVSPAQALVSYRQVSGSLSGKISKIRDMMVHLAAELEAAIEFPEDGLRISPRKHARALGRLEGALEALVGSYERGKAFGKGLTLAIIGSPNVGKSTLFNGLLGEDRAIVTPYPGTTRDYLRETMVIRDAVFLLVDMAGLGAPGHPIEREGMAKGRRIAEEADGLLLVVDASRKQDKRDEGLLRQYGGRKSVLVLNKCDLQGKADLKRIRALAGETPLLRISALRGSGLKALKEAIHQRFAGTQSADEEIVIHRRQRDALEEIRRIVVRASGLLEEGHSEEIIAEEIRRAVPLIGRLTGEIRSEDVMNDIFGRFCVGK